MTKKGHKKGVCKTTAKVVGNHVTVKTTCSIKPKAVKCLSKKTKIKHTRKVIAPCKNLTGKLRVDCRKALKKYY